MNTLFRWLCAPLLLVLTGCYSYVAVPPDGAPRGAAVRVRTSPAEAERLARVLGREDRVLEGRLIEAERGSVLVQVPTLVGSSTAATDRLNQRIRLSSSQIVEMEIRRLDRWRTVGLIAAGAVAAGALVMQAFGDDPGSVVSGPGKGGGDRWVGWRIRFPAETGRGR